MSIPKNINKKHVIQALQKIDEEGVPEKRDSTRFNVLYKGKRYPPKYVISIANIFANGEEHLPSKFSGGKETNNFFENLGFKVFENQIENFIKEQKNTWIFQGNPTVFDIDKYVNDHQYIWWSLRQKHYADKVRIGDNVFLWRSDGDQKGTGGILAKAKVVSFPQEEIDDKRVGNYWHKEDRTNLYLSIKLEVLEIRLNEGFISRLSLLENSVLNDLLILRLRQQTNYLLPLEHATELQNLWESTSSNIRDVLDSNDLENIVGYEIIETEREQIVKTRIGQSAFKKALLTISKKCSLCGVSDERFLIASHIKPWSQSDSQERLDVNNGLLLCPNHDSLFDKGYISFDQEGTILISNSLSINTKVFLNINENIKVKTNERTRKCMNWHQKNVYKN